MGWPKTRLDVARGVQPSTLAAIAAMNRKASELSDAIDAFDRASRERVRVPATAPTVDGADQPDPRRAGAEALLEELATDPIRGAFPEIVCKPGLFLRLVPWAAIGRPRLDSATVGRAQSRFPPSVGEQVHSDADGRQWWSCAPPRRSGNAPNPETEWLMRLVRPGALEYKAVIGNRVGDDAEILVDGRRLEGAIIGNLDRMAAIAAELGLQGPALVQIGLEDVENVRLTRSRPGRRRFRAPHLVLPTIELADLTSSVVVALQDSLNMLWQAGGRADGSPSFTTGAWAGYDSPVLYQLE